MNFFQKKLEEKSFFTEGLLVRNFSTKIVRRILSDERNGRRVQISVDLSTHIEVDEDFFVESRHRSKTWCYQYDQETKR